MFTAMRPSHDPSGYDLLSQVYPGDDLIEHFRFIRANVRRDGRGAAAELRVVAARLVLAAAMLEPEQRAVSLAAAASLERLADRVERGDPVKQLDLDHAFTGVRMSLVSVRWLVLQARWQTAQAQPPTEWADALVTRAQELEQALWLLGSELGKAIEPAVNGARALVGALYDQDPGSAERVRMELAGVRAALGLLGLMGIGERATDRFMAPASGALPSPGTPNAPPPPSDPTHAGEQVMA